MDRISEAGTASIEEAATAGQGSAAPSGPLSVELGRALYAARGRIDAGLKQKARLHIADSIGIAVAARNSPLSGSVVSALTTAAGTGSSPLLSGGSAAPVAAAFINASLIHILDYDDIHDEGRLHPSAVIIPAVLAASSLVQLSDDAFIEAVVLGSELICRLGKVCAPQGQGPGADWFLTQLFGYVAAAAAASVALGLNEEQAVSAMGLAYMQAAGGKQAGFGTGANARAIYPAFAAQGGVQAAILTKEGIVGPEGSLDGAAGLFPLYFGGMLSARQRAELLDMAQWHFRDVEPKPWPSCRLSHPYIAVGLAARQQVIMYPEASIRLAVNASAARLCRPLEHRRVPQTLQDAKYSLPFMTAFALVRGEPCLSTLDEKTLSDQELLEMAARIDVDETLPDNPGHPLAQLTIECDGDAKHTYTFSPADLQMGEDAIRSKFMACMEYASVAQDNAAIWQQLMAGSVVSAIAELCSPAGKRR